MPTRLFDMCVSMRCLFEWHLPPSRRVFVCRSLGCAMSGGELSELRARKRKLDSDLADVRRAEANARKARWKQSLVQSRVWCLTGRARNTALAVFMLADFAAEPVVVYLRRVGGQRRWPDRSDGELMDCINDTFSVEAAADLVNLVDYDVTHDMAALTTASDIVHQWRVALWTAEQNRKGITPSTGAVLDEFETRRAQLPEYARAKAWGTSGEQSARQRASRWRRRWGGRIGKFQALEEVPLDAMVEKACM